MRTTVVLRARCRRLELSLGKERRGGEQREREKETKKSKFSYSSMTMKRNKIQQITKATPYKHKHPPPVTRTFLTMVLTHPVKIIPTINRELNRRLKISLSCSGLMPEEREVGEREVGVLSAGGRGGKQRNGADNANEQNDARAGKANRLCAPATGNMTIEG